MFCCCYFVFVFFCGISNACFFFISDANISLKYYYRGQPKTGTGLKIQSVPFGFSTSRFQGPAFGCDKIVVIVTLLEAIEGRRNITAQREKDESCTSKRRQKQGYCFEINRFQLCKFSANLVLSPGVP